MKKITMYLSILMAAVLLASCSKKLSIPLDLDGKFLKGAGTLGAIVLDILPQDTDIIRTTPSGTQRMVYYDLSSSTQSDLQGLTASISKGTFSSQRTVIGPAGTNTSMMNIMWIPENITTGISILLKNAQGDTVLQETINLQVAPSQVVIPMSPAVKETTLQPLILRGTNYLPRYHPFTYMWTGATRTDFVQDFLLMDSLNLNSLRSFYIAMRNVTHYSGLTFKPGTIALANDLYDVSDIHHLKMVMCMGASQENEDINDSKRFMQSGIEPFMYDGRILMWDLVNEPGGAGGPQATPALASWMQTMYQYVTTLDTNHMHTVGLAWQFDQEHALGIFPDAEQYHQYSGSVGLPTYPGERNVRDDILLFNTQCGGKPLMLGEYGISSNNTPEHPSSLAHQLDIYTWVYQGVNAAVQQGANVVGLFNWCAFHYPTLGWSPFEQGFGVIDENGILKPAGQLMRNTHAAWKAVRQAPWE